MNEFLKTTLDFPDEIKDAFDELEGKEVSIAGRIMFKRVMGKASFCNVRDLQGDIQAYITRDDIGDDNYADFKKYDVGDIVDVLVIPGCDGRERRKVLCGQKLSGRGRPFPADDGNKRHSGKAGCYHCKGEGRGTPANILCN